MKRLLRLTLLAAVLSLALAAPALAHGGNPDYRSVVNKVTPDVPGVSVEVLDYDSHMQLLDREGHEVVIYGYDGEPYARILEDGTVQVNERSPATYLNEDRFAEVTVPPIANPKAPPKWKTIDDSGTFIWHDHRMHYMSPTTPPQLQGVTKKTKVFDYRIPVKIDGRKGAVDGTLWWVGPANTSKLPFVIAGIVIVVLGAAAVLFARRRRREEGDGDGESGEDAGGAPKEAW